MSLVESLSVNNEENLLEDLASRLDSNYDREITDGDLAIMGMRRKIETDYESYVEEYARTMFDKVFEVVDEGVDPYTSYFMFRDDRFHRDTHEAFCSKLGINAGVSAELEVFEFRDQGIVLSRQAMLAEPGDPSSAYALSYVAQPSA